MNLKGLNAKQTSELVPDSTFLLGYRGSISHGTYTPTYGKCEHDDKDLMGACFGPRDHYLGFNRFEQLEKMLVGEDGVMWDSVVYEIRKFFSLLLKGNPNVLTTLWIPENLYILNSDIGKELIANRDWFVGRHAYKPFRGYAVSQRSKMDRSITSNIGQARKALVEKFGFDVKHASHLIRLLRMGIEFLAEGTLYVYRNDAQELIDIKNGLWSRERVVKESDRLIEMLDYAYLNSKLPDKPNIGMASEFLGDCILDYLNVP